MKILHLCSERGWRGGEQQIAYLISELRNRGVENILCVKKGSALEEHCIKYGFKYITASFSNSFDILSAYKIHSFCKSNAIDLIHLHTSKAHGVAVLSTLFGNKTKMVLSRRVDFRLQTNKLSLWKYNHPSIHRILCVSNKIKEIVQETITKKEIAITVYSGIDIEKFSDQNENKQTLRKEFSINSNTTIIGNTSALADHKDYFTFIRTIQFLKQKGKNVHGFIIGDGELKDQLKNFTIELGLENTITFTGFRTDIQKLLPSLDIFLMTSKEEGLGTSILDAFVAKVPVVATAAGGIPEMVKQKETGMLNPIGAADKLAESITRLMEDSSLRDKLIENASILVRQFSKEATASRTYEVYKQVILE